MRDIRPLQESTSRTSQGWKDLWILLAMDDEASEMEAKGHEPRIGGDGATRSR